MIKMRRGEEVNFGNEVQLRHVDSQMFLQEAKNIDYENDETPI